MTLGLGVIVCVVGGVPFLIGVGLGFLRSWTILYVVDDVLSFMIRYCFQWPFTDRTASSFDGCYQKQKLRDIILWVQVTGFPPWDVDSIIPYLLSYLSNYNTQNIIVRRASYQVVIQSSIRYISSIYYIWQSASGRVSSSVSVPAKLQRLQLGVPRLCGVGHLLQRL